MTDNKLADALREIQVMAADADLRATHHRTALETISRKAREALAEHDAPDECFCDRMYPDSNPNASCGDCPTRDYAPQPPSIPEPSDEDIDGALTVAFGEKATTGEAEADRHWRDLVRDILTTDRARLRERIGV